MVRKMLHEVIASQIEASVASILEISKTEMPAEKAKKEISTHIATMISLCCILEEGAIKKEHIEKLASDLQRISFKIDFTVEKELRENLRRFLESCIYRLRERLTEPESN